MNRIDRLTAILVHLQSKRVVKAEELAGRFEISLRTVYRDVKALMEAGVPIGSEAGKGYFIVDGFHLPPVMFSPDEASAMLLAGKLVEKMTDQSIRQAFESALLKIKAVLNTQEKDRLESLEDHIEVWRRKQDPPSEFPNKFLTEIQEAVVQKHTLQMAYFSPGKNQVTARLVEPIGLFYYGTAWHLIAWCQLRKDYRDFRVDRIKEMKNTGQSFSNTNLLSLKQYIDSFVREHQDVEKIVVSFNKDAVRYLGDQKYLYGYVTEEDLGEKVRVTFLTCWRQGIARWLICFGNHVEVEEPLTLNNLLIEMVEELNRHYLGTQVPE